jgi:hypothetical protein
MGSEGVRGPSSLGAAKEAFFDQDRGRGAHLLHAAPPITAQCSRGLRGTEGCSFPAFRGNFEQSSPAPFLVVDHHVS